ncbi:hypothetical protein D4764_16G0000220 [Takifugu flavidus]|uniref:Uncharacterized protein n=1 Tax=Takifugu flavidus TaxID=433684 RepID=A0A5C6NX19_9TELE|nr:hypothetical protein D4764_16G0000220 [Takifugu flavidus]
MVSKVGTILDNPSHPLHNTVDKLRSSFSNRLLQPRCSQERIANLDEVVRDRMVSKVGTILDNPSHPLHNTVDKLRSSFSNRLLQPRCSQERCFPESQGLTPDKQQWQGCPLDTFLVRCSGHIPPVGGPQEDPGHVGELMSLDWSGNTWGFFPDELEEVAEEREVWASLLRLQPPRPDPG